MYALWNAIVYGNPLTMAFPLHRAFTRAEVQYKGLESRDHRHAYREGPGSSHVCWSLY